MITSFFAISAKVENLETSKAEIAKLYGELSRLKLELQHKSEDEIRISRQLCQLQARLLEDGYLKYLEKIWKLTANCAEACDFSLA